ncbi:elongation of very long chain fatty acids protein 4-like [Acanthaster planci]|uniref:Elongation of very long chain fatty acids protein n=1 Tax=Acanthaster planci TaxID=133434 RepID=A0A8B7ZN73_ACAPL|nr:elongation of very long chain fatty acids protein 4-like [Acanthaster planci]XP_022106345.1 elongation of very long chain fatty acids protein 4-like [Acanthaster planci]XP_022106346.1 elongation of very long chain fatty acids protein 4-like [Acanthaster planci]
MVGVVEYIKSKVAWAESVADPRTKDWFLMDSPVPSYSLVMLYLMVVWWGPRYMADRKPFDLKYIMMAYNLALVVLSAYMFKEFFVTTILNPNFNSVCQAVDYSEDPMALRLAAVCWWFFFSKVIELLDTVIFILRKKNSQITFLHVYHHSTMVLLWWIGVRWVAGGNSYSSGMVNCLIHTLMYSYYFLSALGPSVQPFLWWKKYLTSLQLLQFFGIMIHSFVTLYLDCGFPDPYVYALIGYLISHIILFSNFYRKSYGNKDKKKKSGDATSEQEQAGGRRYNLRQRSGKN